MPLDPSGISLIPLNAQGRDLIRELNAEQALRHAYSTHDDLKADLDKLAVQVEKLLAERAHTIEVLSAFYRAEVSLSSLQPVLTLAETLNPALKGLR